MAVAATMTAVVVTTTVTMMVAMTVAAGAARVVVPGRATAGATTTTTIGTTAGQARRAAPCRQGVALPLNRVMPVVRQAVPGRVLDVDLQQWATGGWVYKFLVLNSEGEYSEVFVDALSRRIVRVRER